MKIEDIQRMNVDTPYQVEAGNRKLIEDIDSHITVLSADAEKYSSIPNLGGVGR